MFLWIRDELETEIGSSRPQQTWVQEEAGVEWMDVFVNLNYLKNIHASNILVPLAEKKKPKNLFNWFTYPVNLVFYDQAAHLGSPTTSILNRQ